MRLCRRHGWVRASLQSGELSMTAAAQLETTFAGAERAERQSRTGRRNVGQGRGHDQDQDHDSAGQTRQLGLPVAPGEAGKQGERGRSLGSPMTALATNGAVAGDQSAPSPGNATGHQDRCTGIRPHEPICGRAVRTQRPPFSGGSAASGPAGRESHHRQRSAPIGAGACAAVRTVFRRCGDGEQTRVGRGKPRWCAGSRCRACRHATAAAGVERKRVSVSSTLLRSRCCSRCRPRRAVIGRRPCSSAADGCPGAGTSASFPRPRLCCRSRLHRSLCVPPRTRRSRSGMIRSRSCRPAGRRLRCCTRSSSAS